MMVLPSPPITPGLLSTTTVLGGGAAVAVLLELGPDRLNPPNPPDLIPPDLIPPPDLLGIFILKCKF
jgi:hypothetical protein